MFERLLEGMLRLAAFRDFFLSQKLLPLKFCDALLISRNNRGVTCIHDTVKKLIDLLIEPLDFGLKAFGRVGRTRFTHVPSIAEHSFDKREQPLSWLQSLQDAFKLAFQRFPLDRLTIARTAFCRTQVIRIFLVLTFRPTGGERLFTVVAEDKPAQRKVCTDILACRCLRRAFQPCLNLLIRFKANQTLMLAFTQRDTPIWGLDIASIKRTRQELIDALIADFAIWQVFWECVLAFQEAFHFDLRFKTCTRVTLERLFQNGCKRLVTDQNLALAADTLVAIANGRLKNPVATLNACAHTVDRLFTVLLPLVLRNRCQQVFDKLRIGIFAELDGRANEYAASITDFYAQFKMRHQAPCKAADVVNNNGMRLFTVCAQEGEHCLHTGPRGEAAGAIICKYLGNLIVFVLCELAAARFLRTEAITAHGLLCA